jgi:hypothetical protein
MAKTKRKTKPAPTMMDATPERLSKGESIITGMDDNGRPTGHRARVFTTLHGELFEKGDLSQSQYAAAYRYDQITFEAGYCEPRAITYDRIGSGGHYLNAPSPDRKMDAQDALKIVHGTLTPKMTHALEYMIVGVNKNGESVGTYSALAYGLEFMGQKNRSRARSRALEQLQAALDVLCDLWGL